MAAKDKNPDEPVGKAHDPAPAAGRKVEDVADDVRDGRFGMRADKDPKDDPTLPDDVSAIADPEGPTKIMDPGEDPDFQGQKKK